MDANDEKKEAEQQKLSAIQYKRRIKLTTSESKR